MAAHLAYTLLDDAFDRASPTRMKHTNGTARGINENDGQAIGGLNAEQQTRSRCDQTVADKLWFRGRIDEADDIGMNLSYCDQRPEGARSPPPPSARTEFMQKRSAVALDCGFGVVFGETQVECFATVGAG